MDSLFVDETIPYRNGAVIKVVGVGGAGGNALSNMIKSNIGGIEYIAINTDSQALAANAASTKILLGKGGLGAGSKPEVGRIYALECVEDIRRELKNTDLVFITCGLGGGTGTGAAPVVAAEARSAGALTVAVVYMPSTASGRRRNEIAKNGLEELMQYVDSFIIVPNDGMQDAGHKLTYNEALKMADDVLRQSIQGISEMASVHGDINIDFADIRTAMAEKGKAVMGIGSASGENRAKDAFESALKSPLLSDTNIKGSYAVLLNISGNIDDIMMDEVSEIQNLAYEYAGENALIIDGLRYDDRTDGSITVTIVATGISVKQIKNDNLTKIDDKRVKPTQSVSEIASKVRTISKDDKNLVGIDSLNDAIYDIPTYLRKQAD